MLRISEYAPVIGYSVAATTCFIGAFITAAKAQFFIMRVMHPLIPPFLIETHLFAAAGAYIVSACLMAACTECFFRARECLREIRNARASLQGHQIMPIEAA